MRRCKWGDNDGATHLKGLSSNPLNSSVYVHELGHFLLGNGVQTALPNSLKLLARNGMFNELLCDAFALAVTGRVFSQEPGIPACAANTRIVTRGQSYRAQRGYFDVNFGNRRIEACCNHIRKKSEGGDFYTYVCEGLRREHSFYFPKFDRSPLVPTEYAMFSKPMVDIHQVGLPINSFLVELSERIDRSVLELVLDAARTISEKDLMREMTCSLANGFVSNSPVRHSYASIPAFFSHMRKQLSNDLEREAFDSLALKHTLATGFKIADVYSKTQVDRVIREQVEAKDPECKYWTITYIDCLIECLAGAAAQR